MCDPAHTYCCWNAILWCQICLLDFRSDVSSTDTIQLSGFLVWTGCVTIGVQIAFSHGRSNCYFPNFESVVFYEMCVFALIWLFALLFGSELTTLLLHIAYDSCLSLNFGCKEVIVVYLVVSHEEVSTPRPFQ